MAEGSVEDIFKRQLFQKFERNSNHLLPKTKYYEIVQEIKASFGKTRKTPRQYKLLSRYELLQCGYTEKLIKKRASPADSPVYFVTIEETYDVIKTAHLATGHGGRDKMIKELEKNFANVHRDSIELFKSFCKVCQEKTKRLKTKSVVVRPVLRSEFSSRGQVDLLDFQSMGDGQYKWIMVYQDHLTKFLVLRPLTSKRAGEVALQLLDIFTLLGAPVILQSDSGSEFAAVVITELKKLWPELRLVQGNPGHPQSQGPVERANSDIKDMLIAWMTDNSTTRWSLGLRFVQFTKNRAYNAAIKRSPYQSMLGVAPRVGLNSTSLPKELLDHFQTEDDLRAFALQAAEASDVNSVTNTNELVTDCHIDQAANVTDLYVDQSASVTDLHVDQASNVTDLHADQATNVNNTTVLKSRHAQIHYRRQASNKGQMEQAERMVKRRRLELALGQRGDTVVIPNSDSSC